MNKVPCIYGENITDDCPVQMMLMQKTAEKHVLPKDISDEDMKLLGQIMEAMTAQLKVDLSMLGLFCRTCPIVEDYKIKLVIKSGL